MLDETGVVAGRAELSAPLICGALVTCTLLFEVRAPILPQGRIRVYFTQSPFYREPPDFGMAAKGFIFYHRIHFQTNNSQGMGYLTAVATSGRPIQIELEKGRCFFTLFCAEGLPAGDRLRVVIGDSQAGGPGIEVVHHPTYGDWQLLCTVDRQGNGDFVQQTEMPTLRVVTASPSKLLVHLPSQTRPGEPCDLQITVVDRYGNHVEGYAGRFQVTSEGSDQTAVDFALAPEDGGSRRFAGGVVFSRPGIHRVNVTALGEDGTPLTGASNPIDCQAERGEYQLLWADLHGHTWCTDGTHSPAFYYHYGRTVGFLDVCALTEHDTISQQTWQELVATAERQ